MPRPGLRHWPFLLPVVYFAVVWWLQPADRFVPPGGLPAGDTRYPLTGGWARVVYEDVDNAAFVLRSVNAEQGRLGGRPDEPDGIEPADFPEYAAGNPPLELRYFTDYPPLALYLFRLGFRLSDPPAGPVNSAVLDSNYFNVSHYEPASEFDRAMWRSFRVSQRIYSAVFLAALLGVMWLTYVGVGANGRAKGPVWLLVLPGVLYFAGCRYDILPAALTLFAVAATDRRRPLLAALLLGLATALKLYPLVVAPILLRTAAGSVREAVRWSAAFAAPLVASYLPMLLTDGVQGVLGPFQFQMSRPAEQWWIFYGRVIPAGLALAGGLSSVFRAVVLLAVVGGMALRRPPDVESVLRRCAVAVLLFLIMKLKLHAFLALILVSLLTALATQVPLEDVVATMTSG
ncbi:MAG: glycosyltransferase 87 family protein, partial [Gemmataceae bacterium]